MTGWIEAVRLIATIIEGGSIDNDPAEVTAIPCQVPSSSRAVTNETEAATSRILARKASVMGLATISSDDIWTVLLRSRLAGGWRRSCWF